MYFRVFLLVLCAGLLAPYLKRLHEFQNSHILNAILPIPRISWKWYIFKLGFFHYAGVFWHYWNAPDFHQFTPNLHCYERKKNQVQNGFVVIRSALLWLLLSDKSQSMIICSYYVPYKTYTNQNFKLDKDKINSDLKIFFSSFYFTY